MLRSRKVCPAYDTPSHAIERCYVSREREREREFIWTTAGHLRTSTTHSTAQPWGDSRWMSGHVEQSPRSDRYHGGKTDKRQVLTRVLEEGPLPDERLHITIVCPCSQSFSRQTPVRVVIRVRDALQVGCCRARKENQSLCGWVMGQGIIVGLGPRPSVRAPPRCATPW